MSGVATQSGGDDQPTDGTWIAEPYSHRHATFVQHVREFRPSDLLPALAARSAAGLDIGKRPDPLKTRPWVAAAIARESILRGNEHRSAPVDRAAIERLEWSFGSIFNEVPDPTIEQLILPIAYQQFGHQESIYEELARTGALLIDTPLPPIAGPDVADWESLLGLTLLDAWRATFALYALVVLNQGQYLPHLLDDPASTGLYVNVPREAIEATAKRLTATVDQAKADHAAQPPLAAHLEQYGYNPLQRTPLVRLDDGRTVAPQPALILHTMTPTSLYYTGTDAWERYAEQTGHRVEAYVGRQLSTIAEARVLPEIVYGKSRSKSIDWFVITDSAVVLLESKSLRLPLDARAGGASLHEVLRARLGQARAQIDRTHQEIVGGNPAFGAIPTDRPFVGLVVTSDPIRLANHPTMIGDLPDVGIPTLTASLRELEELVVFAPSMSPLVQISRDARLSTWGLDRSLRDVCPVPEGRNPLLEAAWAVLSPGHTKRHPA